MDRELTFLSYAHSDLNQVRNIYTGLKDRGIKVWFDKKDLSPGRFKPKILKAISQSKYFIFCLSSASLAKISLNSHGFVDTELQAAWNFACEQDEKIFEIIPVRLEDCGRGDMRLSGWQQYDLFLEWEKCLDELAVHLGGISLSDVKASDVRTDSEKMIGGLMGKAELFFLSGDYDRALSIVGAIIAISPVDYKAWYNKGAILGRLGRNHEALEAFDKAIKVKPDDPYAWYIKGVTLFNLGQTPEDALEAFDKAIENKPDAAFAWIFKGAVLAEFFNQDEDALEAINKAIEIDPDHYGPWYNLACYYSIRGETGKALNAFRNAIEKGLNNLTHIRQDKALDNIRNEKEFQELISLIKS